MIRQKLFLLILLILSSITGCIGRAYIDTAKFVNDGPGQAVMTAFPLEVKPFESQLQDRSRVGTKRVSDNKFSGPILATQDPVSVAQQGVITQLGKKGITVGSSPLQLRGTVQDFFVDVDVNPASGRGKFSALVTVELAVWDAESRQQIWHETYTGKAILSAPSAIDSAYEKALTIAFTNLMTQLQQDDRILDVKHFMPRPRPKPPPHRPPSDRPQIIILRPQLSNGSSQITVSLPAMSISGLVASPSDIAEVRVTGAGQIVQTALASAQELKAVGLTGKGMKFTAFARLAPGPNRVKVLAIDSKGIRTQQDLTIQKQAVVDNTPPQFVVSESRTSQGRGGTGTAPTLSVTGFAWAPEGLSEVQVNGNTAEMVPASEQESQSVGSTGKVVRFIAEIELEKGTKQVEITAVDRDGNAASPKMLTIPHTQ
jgi:hypothetical protein